MRIRKYESVRAVEAGVSRSIESGDLDQALKLIYAAVERVITEPLCTAQVFGSTCLDALCQRIGAINFAERLGGGGDAALPQSDSQTYVYVVTKLQSSGGHTRIIQDFIEARPECRHLILSTELDGASDVARLLQSVGSKARLFFEAAPEGDYQQRLSWLQKRLMSTQAVRVYLFNHHQDSVAVAAVQPEMGLDASFYHHGDHHLCLGVYLTGVEHIDPHPMGYHNCRSVLGIENTYVPYSIEDQEPRPRGRPFLHRGALTTCTAARSNKLEIPYFISYVQVVPELLQATGGVHIHIGRLTPWALFRIRRGLKRLGISRNRFVYLPWVSSVWHALVEHNVDLYIASFPYGGGLTSMEAMGAGIPVVLHQHLYSQMLSGIDLVHPGTFTWRSTDDLMDYCSSLTAVDLDEAGRLGRSHFEKYHRKGDLRAMLDAAAIDRSPPVEPSEDFSLERDEWAWWMERQVSLGQVMRKAGYRAFRRLRSWL